MNRTFKIVGKYTELSIFNKGKLGLQAKKRVYTSLIDFEKYAPDTIMRWRNFCKFDVTIFELVKGKWILTLD